MTTGFIQCSDFCDKADPRSPESASTASSPAGCKDVTTNEQIAEHEAQDLCQGEDQAQQPKNARETEHAGNTAFPWSSVDFVSPDAGQGSSTSDHAADHAAHQQRERASQSERARDGTRPFSTERTVTVKSPSVCEDMTTNDQTTKLESHAPTCRGQQTHKLANDGTTTAYLLQTLRSMTAHSCVHRICEQIDSVSAKFAKKVAALIAVIANWPVMQPFLRSRKVLVEFINHPVVVCVLFLCIIGNAVVVTMHVHDSLSTPATRMLPELLDMQRVFTIIFAAEVLLRLLGEGPRFFSQQERAWNLLDALINTVAVLNPIFDISSVGTVTVLRLVRGFRGLWLIPANSFFRELRTMVCMIYYSISSLIWAAMLVTLIVFLFSLVLASAIAAFVREQGASSIRDLNIWMLDEWYGSLPRVMMTLLQAAFGGQGWGDSIWPPYQVGMPYVIVFLAYQSLMMFSLINIMTGVFVENTRAAFSNDKCLAMSDYLFEEKNTLNKANDIFTQVRMRFGRSQSSCDADEDPDALELDKCKIHQILSGRVVLAHLHTLGISMSKARSLFHLLHDEKNCCETFTHGKVTVERKRFNELCLKHRGEVKAIDVHKLHDDHRKLHDDHQQLVKTVNCFYRDADSKLKEQREHLDHCVDKLNGFHKHHNDHADGLQEIRNQLSTASSAWVLPRCGGSLLPTMAERTDSSRAEIVQL